MVCLRPSSIRLLAAACCIIMMMPFTMLRAEAIGWVGDLPVPGAALIDTSTAVAFDSPSGRVVIFTFEISSDAQAISSFYDSALPNLGWQAVGASYRRGNEQMAIARTGQAANGDSRFKVTLKPLS